MPASYLPPDDDSIAVTTKYDRIDVAPAIKPHAAAGGGGDAFIAAAPTTSALPVQQALSTADKQLLLYLCLIALCLEMKPSEPFLTNYLMEDKGLTEEQVNHEVYPIYVYSFFAALLPMGIASAYIGYKRMMLLCIAAREVTRLLLIWATSLLAMQLMQVTFGIAQIDNIISMSYLYAVMPSYTFVTATGLYNASPLIGHIIAGLLGQGLVSAGVPLVILFYIALGSVTVGAVMFLFTPDDKTFPKRDAALTSATPTVSSNTEQSMQQRMMQYAQQLYHNYTANNCYILRWSLWWILAMGITDMAANYIVSLYYEVDDSINYQGLVDTLARLSAAAASIVPAYIPAANTSSTAATAAWCSISALCAAVMLFTASATTSLYLCYAYYCVFSALQAFSATQVSAAMALGLDIKSFATLFTINTFGGVCFESALQYIVGDSGLQLSARDTFLTMAIYMVGVAALLVLTGVVMHIREKSSARTAALSYNDKLQTDFDDSFDEL